MGIALLKSPDTDEQVGSAAGKATIPNKQFHPAFTSETALSVDHSKPHTHPDILDITFTEMAYNEFLLDGTPTKPVAKTRSYPESPRSLQYL